jgi:superfamily II DNA or RNA helicase
MESGEGVVNLYQWQKEALERFSRAAYFALVVDCGLGKTVAAALIAHSKNRPTLVIAPGNSLCAQWKAEIRKALGPDEDVWVYSRTEETKRGEDYRKEFATWLTV